MSKTKNKPKRYVRRKYVTDPNSVVKLTLSLRHYQVEGLGGREKTRDFLYGAINAVSVAQEN